jgi:hypothetical protein
VEGDTYALGSLRVNLNHWTLFPSYLEFRTIDEALKPVILASYVQFLTGQLPQRHPVWAPYGVHLVFTQLATVHVDR